MTELIRIFENFGRALSAFSGMLIFVIICIVAIDIIGRGVLNAPIPGATTFSVLLLVCLVFLSLANVQRNKEHYRVDLIAEMLPPKARKVVDLAAHAVSLVIITVLAFYSTGQAITSFERGEASYDLFAFPVWPARMVLAIGFILLALQLVIDLTRDIDDLRGREDPQAR